MLNLGSETFLVMNESSTEGRQLATFVKLNFETLGEGLSPRMRVKSFPILPNAYLTGRFVAEKG